MDRLNLWVRRGLWLLPAYGVLTFYATLTHQPDPDTEFERWSRYVTTGTFLISHIFGSILGAAVAILALAALLGLLAGGSRSTMALIGFVMGAVGNVMVAAIFGIAAGAQPALGEAFLAGNSTAQDLYTQVYSGPVFAVAGVGVLLFSIGFVLMGLAAASDDRIPRWAAASVAIAGPLIGIAGFIFGPAQTVGSVLMVAGGVAIARAVAAQSRQ